MACRLFGAKPLSKPMLDYCQLYACEHIYQNITISTEENAFENVVHEMYADLWIEYAIFNIKFVCMTWMENRGEYI